MDDLQVGPLPVAETDVIERPAGLFAVVTDRDGDQDRWLAGWAHAGETTVAAEMEALGNCLRAFKAALDQDRRRPILGREGHVAADDLLGFGGCRTQLDLAQDRPKDDAHLELGEGGTDAAAGAAAKGDPAEGLRLLIEEALGPEPIWLGVDVGARVGQVDRGADDGADREVVAAQ